MPLPFLNVGDKIECLEFIKDDRNKYQCEKCIFNNIDCVNIEAIPECCSEHRKDKKDVYYKLIKGSNND